MKLRKVGPVWLNPDHVMEVLEVNGVTTVYLSDGRREIKISDATVDEVAQALNG